MTKERSKVITRWTPVGTADVSAEITLLGARQGHGLAAERANHLKDVISGKDAKLVGGNNAKNGPDRLVNGKPIQTKYHRSGSRGVAACFEDGRHRYPHVDGSPMATEIPRDQYESGLRAMERRIARGEVPGVTDPQAAKALVRRGFVTYEQAVNITKFGTIESLAFDAVNCVKVGGAAFGVATVASYALAIWRGENADYALADAYDAGLRTSVVAWASGVLAAQLGRTALGRTIRGNALSAVATTVILSSTHFAHLFRGEASAAQVFKDVTTTAASVAGSVVGWQLCSRLGAGVGPVAALVFGAVGALAFGNLCESAARTVLDAYIKDDADEMMAVAETAFQRLALHYRLTDDEAIRVVQHFKSGDLPATLREMHASTDRLAFAQRLLSPLMEGEVQRRGLPTE